MTEISRAIDLVSQAYNIAEKPQLKRLLAEIERLLIQAEELENLIESEEYKESKGET